MSLNFLSSHKGTTPTDPQTREFQKRIAQDARVDQKTLDHAMNDLKKADKTHLNAVKAADKSQHALDKAVEKEHKSATALNKAQQQHEVSVAAEQNAEKTLELNRQHQARLEQDLQQRRATVDESQHRKHVNDQFRETKLSEIHAEAASRADSRANSVNRGPYPVGRGPTGGSETQPSSDVNANGRANADVSKSKSNGTGTGANGSTGPAAEPTSVPSA